jgi:predicted nucleotidyltransferase
MNTLVQIFSSKVRAALFGIFFGLRRRPVHMRELERLTEFAIGTIQQELKKLVSINLVKRTRDGNRVYYEANIFHPLYPEIHRIVLKTTGLTDLVKKALEGNAKIRIAFIFGSIATGTEKAESDVDLMVIGDVGLRRLSALLSVVPDQIGREVNPHTLSSEEFKRKKAQGDHFLTTVLGEPKIFVIGSEDELNRMV